MTLWFAFALMTAAAIFAVLWPLGRRAGKPGGSDLAVYRDQLDEIARDRADGRLGLADAAIGAVARDLVQLISIDREVAAAGLACTPAERPQNGEYRRRGHQRKREPKGHKTSVSTLPAEGDR